MHPIDWLVLALPLVMVFGIAAYTRRYVRGVADFLAAGRCAGRYLLANARGEAESGLASSLAVFEQIFVAGFVLNFWEKLQTPVVVLVGISGFVVYRLRETRAMTLAQFFEMRYSRRFRLFMGFLAFLSGILNYGIFPAVSARFFIYFLNLPQSLHVGPLALPTFALIMAAYLSCTVFMTLIGGQVTLMVVDCIEGLLSHLIYIVLALTVFVIVGWHHIVDVTTAAPAGHSPVNPFDTTDVPDFNLWFMAMALFIRVYITGAFQGRQGFVTAARTPHEARMGGVLGEWRGYARSLMLLLLCVCALTFMRHPAFSRTALPIHDAIAAIHDGYLQKQMTVPIALRYLLPVGAKGLFCAIMVMGLLASDSSHQHAWGSIFIQDVILPLRNERPFSPAAHLWALRCSVVGVAMWAFVFSLVFPQTQYIALWWQLTGGLFTGGAGAAIIGGLYWRKGTTAAAWAGALTGVVLSMTGIICTSFWPWIGANLGPLLHVSPPAKFWLNGMQAAFLAAVAAAFVYVVTASLSSRRRFDLDRMLHRGRYAIASDHDRAQPVSIRERFTLRNILRFDANFTRSDKLVVGGIFWWAMAMAAVNVVATAWNLLIRPWPVTWWTHYWLIVGIFLPFVIAVVTFVWFGIGAVGDLRLFFAALRTMKRDARDDGRVVGRHNAADEAAKPPSTREVVAVTGET
jgi:SSS family solute:Na+ symporter